MQSRTGTWPAGRRCRHYKKAQHKSSCWATTRRGSASSSTAGRSTEPLRSCLGSDERAGANGWRSGASKASSRNDSQPKAATQQRRRRSQGSREAEDG